MHVDLLDGEILVFENVELGILLPGDVLALVGVVLGFLFQNFLDGFTFGHDMPLVVEILLCQSDIFLPQIGIFFMKGCDFIGIDPTQTEVLFIGAEQKFLDLLILLDQVLDFEVRIVLGVAQ